MAWVNWLVYIASFFIPVFGFITFWVFGAKGDDELARGSMIAAFFGLVVYIILTVLGVTVFHFLWQGVSALKLAF
jgi:hypothetical protein